MKITVSRKAIIALLSCFISTLCAQTAEPVEKQFNIFTMPRLQPGHLFYVENLKKAINKSDYTAMKDICLAALQILPDDPTWHYNTACAFSRLGYFPEAIAELKEAVELGFSNAEILSTDSDIASLRSDSKFAEILAKAKDLNEHPDKNPSIKKASAIGNTADVTIGNTEWNFDNGGFTTKFIYPGDTGTLQSQPVVLPGEAGDLIRQWQQEGTAAGNAGDLYENRDNRHSVFDLKNFPDFKEIKFCKEAKDVSADIGASLFTYGGQPVLGNSSTAYIDPVYWRSNARYAQHEYPHMMFLQYMNNQMYVYPQHEDYRANKFGDVFVMRNPYSYIAPGSSWTDKPVMAALAAAMAAFRPETKQALIKSRQLAPALQYIIRSSLNTVKKREDYLTPLAHPVVIDGKSIDTVKMVKLAHSITTNCLPPFATFLPKFGLKQYRQNVDFFDNFNSEIFLVSPCASAFIWRGMDYSRHFTLDASSSKDPCGKPLKYHWFIGQGIEKKIRISPENESGSVIRLDIDYHEPPFMSPFKIATSRIDIILVVDNGTHYSPPAFFSYYFLPNEKRTYFSDKAISSVDYGICATNYVDPKVSIPKSWCDFYINNEHGRITGWTRMRKDEAPVTYTSGGMRVVSTDKEGKPDKLASPKYECISPAVGFNGNFELVEKTDE